MIFNTLVSAVRFRRSKARLIIRLIPYLQPVDIKKFKSRWRHNWKSAQVVNSHIVCDPTIQQLGFDLPRQQWSLLNRFRTEQKHCGACRRKWRLTDTDLCHCGETQMMSHIVESCPLTKLNGSLSRLHSADEDAVSWLTSMVHDTHTRRRFRILIKCLIFSHFAPCRSFKNILFPQNEFIAWYLNSNVSCILELSITGRIIIC